MQIQSELASVNIRLFAFAAELAKRGHTALVADVDHLHQVPLLLHSFRTDTSN